MPHPIMWRTQPITQRVEQPAKMLAAMHELIAYVPGAHHYMMECQWLPANKIDLSVMRGKRRCERAC